MDANKKTARIAGAIYLVVVLTGMFSLAYVPSQLIFWNDAAKTLQHITSSQQLYRMGIASSMICYLAFTLLPIVLYRLLRHVDENYAKLMVIFALISVPISLLNLQHKFDVLSIISGADYLKDLSQQQLQSRVLFSLESYDSGLLIVQIFWGLWLFPFGYLVYHSKTLPKILGVFLMLGCFGYLINVLGRTALPNYGEFGYAKYVTLPASIGEIGICLWLLIMGIKTNVKD
ncbi:DUF4386 domain-containing protein [Pedobacter sp. LMG 31643]|nr:DUF4386 domain-containing protein [Pedobacter foliorum]